MRFLVYWTVSSFPMLPFPTNPITLTQSSVAVVQLCWPINASVSGLMPTILVVKYSDHHSYIPIHHTLVTCPSAENTYPLNLLTRWSPSCIFQNSAPVPSSGLLEHLLFAILQHWTHCIVTVYFWFSSLVVSSFRGALFPCSPLQCVPVT